jgi:hypothetical protein
MNPKYAKMAQRLAPEQYQPFATIACEIMDRHGIPVTHESLVERLKGLGRDREAIIERHKRYGKTKRTAKQDQQVGQVEEMAA